MVNEDIQASSSLNLPRLKVLIADDDTPTRILLRAAISQWGYEVIEAKDGQEAWDVLSLSQPADLVILDWLMPKLDGIAICERAKAELNYHPYIILLTQVTGTTNIIKGLEAGADEFLSKPFNMAELRSRLSTGARLVHFKMQLAEQNKVLTRYFQQLNTMAPIAVACVQKIIDSLKGKENIDIQKEIGLDIANLEVLCNDLHKMQELITQFQTDAKIRG